MLLIKMTKVQKIIFVCTFMYMVILYSVPFGNNDNETTKLTTRPMWKTKARPNNKYILQWTKPYTEPFVFMEKGRRAFIRKRCIVENCFITSYRNYLKDLRDFDAILFHGPELSSNVIRLPSKRGSWQKYVFVSRESSVTSPMYYNLGKVYDEFFNWTWTYRLKSDIYYGYIIVKNKNGEIIGPKEIMHWLKVEDMKPIDEKLKKKLKSKKIAAAWIVSHCNTSSRREEIAQLLQQELAKYNMKLDIYGECGHKFCPRNQMKKCLRMLETDYYFYLSFENSVTNDYVTEKLLHALQHYTIPIVYGGANYTRFMPEGTYLNVQSQNIKTLVKRMMSIINDNHKFYDYFRWTNHYSYHDPEEFPESDFYCDFCRKINDYELVSRTSYIQHFSEWWNPKAKKKNKYLCY